MGKKPLNEKQIRTLRKLTAGKPLHSLLLNLSVDLMLRASDLLKLKVSDVMHADRTVKDSIQVKQKKTGKKTIEIPLSENSKKVILQHLSTKSLDQHIFIGQKSHYTGKAISTNQYQRIVKGWMNDLGVEDVSVFSSHISDGSIGKGMYAWFVN